MSGRTPVADLFRALAPVLDGFGGRWYVFGAQAVVAWGRPRLTGDVDVTVCVDLERLGALASALQAAAFEPRVEDVEDFARRTRVLPLLHRPTELPLDVVLAGPGLEEEFANDAIPVSLEGTMVPFIAPADLIVTKVLAGRSKDLEDVRGIVLAQGDDLDVARVRARLDVIERALDRRDLIPLFEAQLPAKRG